MNLVGFARRILFMTLFVIGIALLFAPLQDEISHKNYYMVKTDGTWQEPPNPNICNTHAANITGTADNNNCKIFYIGVPIGLLFAGSFFGLLDYKLPFLERKK
jgi:hypothetical protein